MTLLTKIMIHGYAYTRLEPSRNNPKSYSTDLHKGNLFRKLFTDQYSLPPLPDNYLLPPLIYKTSKRFRSMKFVPHVVLKIMKYLNINITESSWARFYK